MRAGLAGDAFSYRKFLRMMTPHLRAVARGQQRSFRASQIDVNLSTDGGGSLHRPSPIGPRSLTCSAPAHAHT